MNELFLDVDLNFWRHFFSQIGISLAILVGGLVGVRLIVRKTVNIMTRMAGGSDHEGIKKRAKTIVSLLTNVGYVIVLVIVCMMLLNTFGVDIRPLLAGAGIVGFAVGFGSQTLVKDLIAGMFILVENQFSVGDDVELGMHKGSVLQVSVRSTVLEDEDGNILYLRNGDIASVVNRSQKKENFS